MKPIFIIAAMLIGITAAQGQTNGSANSSESAVGSDVPGETTTSLPSVSSPTTGSANGATGATNSAGTSSGLGFSSGSSSGISQAPLLLPGEIPDTSTQAASTTAAAPNAPSPTCPPPVPSTDGGSANLTGMAGISLGGC
jgi:hypothetical protein